MPPPRRLILVLVASLVVVSAAAALIVRLLAEDDFSTIGVSVWWAVQTVTTVGYGDVAPESATGRVVAGLLMIAGYAAVAVVTATVAAAFVDQIQQRRAHGETVILETLRRIEERLDALERRGL